MKQIILVIAAHPDDEVLGCGGTIAKHAKAGDEVHVVILAEGLTSRKNERDRTFYSNQLSKLALAAEKANKVLGVSSLKLYDLPDNRMDSIDRLDVTKLIEQIVDKHKPHIIYSHHIGDVNIDHRCIHQAVVTACRPIPFKHKVNELLFFEVPSSTEWQPSGSAHPFVPNWYVDVSETLDLKLKALKEYESEMRDWPHPRSILAVDYLAKWRGASTGVNAAEAFILGRKLIS
ncbi:GlcNAc-PI de-N-acetylase [Alkalihalophilus pseudofirmus]|nr:GlcNAc-PI de-N-acetylase [Alkalihalophilus pseudofirmus]